MIRNVNRRLCISLCSLLLGVVFSAYPALSQVTNVAQKVSDALSAYGAVPVTTTVEVPRIVNVCKTVPPVGDSHQSHQVCGNQTVYDPKTTTTDAVLTASNIRVINSSQLTYGAATRVELPDHVIPGDYLSKNCTPDPASPSYSVTTIFARTASVALSQSITHTTTAGITVSAKFSNVFGATGSISFADGTTSGTVTTDGSSATVQTTRGGTQSVPAYTFLMIELQTWPVQYTIPFSATATIDADLSHNDRGFQHLSDILSETERTFPISGTLGAQDASGGAIEFYDVAYDQSKCDPTGVTGTPGFKPNESTKLTQRTKQ